MIHSGFRPLKRSVDVGGVDQSFPFLAPAIVDPMSRDSFRHRLVIFLGQLVFRPGVELEIERTQRAHPIVQHLDHFFRRHSVSRDLEREIIRIPHLLRHAVAEIAQLRPGSVSRPDRIPSTLPKPLCARCEIGALIEFVVDVVRRDRFSRRA